MLSRSSLSACRSTLGRISPGRLQQVARASTASTPEAPTQTASKPEAAAANATDAPTANTTDATPVQAAPRKRSIPLSSDFDDLLMPKSAPEPSGGPANAKGRGRFASIGLSSLGDDEFDGLISRGLASRLSQHQRQTGAPSVQTRSGVPDFGTGPITIEVPILRKPRAPALQMQRRETRPRAAPVRPESERKEDQFAAAARAASGTHGLAQDRRTVQARDGQQQQRTRFQGFRPEITRGAEGDAQRSTQSGRTFGGREERTVQGRDRQQQNNGLDGSRSEALRAAAGAVQGSAQRASGGREERTMQPRDGQQQRSRFEGSRPNITRRTAGDAQGSTQTVSGREGRTVQTRDGQQQRNRGAVNAGRQQGANRRDNVTSQQASDRSDKESHAKEEKGEEEEEEEEELPKHKVPEMMDANAFNTLFAEQGTTTGISLTASMTGVSLPKPVAAHQDNPLLHAQVRRTLEDVGGYYRRYFPKEARAAYKKTPHVAGPVACAHLALARTRDATLSRRKHALSIVAKLVAKEEAPQVNARA